MLFTTNKAVDDCIREGILAEFLKAQRAEVIAMSIFEYDQEGHMELVREESLEEGIERGRAEGREEGRTDALLEVFHSLINRGYSKEEALSIVPLAEEQLTNCQADSPEIKNACT